MTGLLLEQNQAINELQFTLAGRMFGPDANKVYHALLRSRLDQITMGFWVWDIQNNIELYSPKFRSVLGFKDENDFPNISQSWMDAIDPDDLRIAMSNYKKHVETKGKHPFRQPVTYNRKNGRGKVKVNCDGMVICWDGEKPLLMVGVHMSPTGLYENTNVLFQSEKLEDVKFDDMIRFDLHRRVNVVPGIDLEMTIKLDDYFRLLCWMKAGYVLSIHLHSDYGELFNCKKGLMIDGYDPTIQLFTGDKHLYEAGTPHIPQAVEDTVLMIEGFKK